MRPIDLHHAFARWLPQLWQDPGAALDAWPTDGTPAFPHYRLALSLGATGLAAPGPADIVALVRAVIRWHVVQGGGINWSLLVPQAIFARGGSKWKHASLHIATEAEGVSIRARQWKPTWSDAPEVAPDDALYELAPRRQDPPEPGDPVLSRLNLSTYKSTAQKAAVRALLTASPGSTVLVNLPTGSGKTVCALVLAMAYGINEGESPGVTPIVVPTVALAADLDRRLRPLVGHPIAYRPSDGVEAANIRSRIAAGQQGPVITSPESLMGSLRAPLCAAARRAMLRAFVVDEAHMVTAWGDEFRPAFQQIPGVRKELALASESATFVTALMSATFSEYNMTAMEELFPPLCASGEFRCIHAPRLRPEPSWWSARVFSESERETHLLDALYHLPRPLIVYALKKRDVARIHQLFSDHGHQRVASISGETDDSTREELIDRWNRDSIDVMVATSAFGLGVDKPDVRAVVHAALPEGLDRLYQDVGRGGRDGRASASLLFWSDYDWQPAAAVASPILIGPKRGRQRWRAMFFGRGKQTLGSDRYCLDVSVQPGSAPGDIDMDSDENQKWNRRTLTLMARAKLLEIDGCAVTEDDRTLGNAVNVRLLRGGLDDETLWNEAVEARRKELQQSYRRNLALLQDALRGSSCIAQILQRCYSSHRYGAQVVRACGGCRFCRAHSIVPTAGKLRAVHHPASPTPSRPIEERLANLYSLRGPRALYFAGPSEGEEWEERMTEVAWHLVSLGIVNVWAPETLLSRWRSSNSLLIPGRPVFLHESFPADVTSLQPTLAVFGSSCIQRWDSCWRRCRVSDAIRHPVGGMPPTTLLVVPWDARDPTRPDRLARLLLAGDRLEDWEQELSE